MRKPRKENPLEEFIRRTRTMVKKHPRLSLVVGAIWLANTLVCLVLAGVWVVWNLPGAQSTGVSATLTPDPSSITALPQPPELVGPVELPPPPDCGQSKLSLGAAEFAIQPIVAALDGSIPVPPDSDGTAYWLEGTDTNYVFALSPTPNNLTLENALQAGDQATITWTNCNSTTFSLSAPQPGLAGDVSLFEQSTSGITLIIQTGPSTPGFTLKGELVEEKLAVIEAPGPTGIQAEVSLLETKTSADGETVQVEISILNYGESAFTISVSDVLLSPPNAAPVTPFQVKPALPENINPGATKTFTFTFPRPSASPAVFKIFDVEFDIEF